MTQTPPHDGDLDALLAYIHERRNFDFRGYKRASLSRRIFKRMQAVGADDYQAYLDTLEANPGEFAELFNTILINVTGLLRDRDAWEQVAKEVLPELVQRKGPSAPIRIWSAGCASGEEAYSLAVLLAEAIGEDRFRGQVKIYATDADTEALAEARRGRYPEKALVDALGEQRTARFFEVDQGYGVFRPDLRRTLIFGRHDLVQDPPISRIDLLACRNTLMYFTSEVQRQVLASFHFALNQGGILFLGKSEALVTRTGLFEPVDLRRHIFRRDGERPAVTSLAVSRTPVNLSPDEAEAGRLSQATIERSAVGHLVVDRSGVVVLANPQARRVFSIGSSAIGAPLGDCGLSVQPREFLSLIQQATRERRAIVVPDVTRPGAPGDPSALYLTFVPLDDKPGLPPDLVAITLVDETRYRTLREDLDRSRHELESAYEEL
ncbi:MAG: PAS domain-containing protein, partial [Acidimicrobiaceae bacterium]|nr:PAS domain-containing protein [Acidimicrobiaceae bacterium]